jgi:hypothetical protein
MKNAQVQNEDAVCIICREGITNPICPACLANEIKSWRPGLSKILTKPAFGYSTEVECMFCGREMSICAHCYCRDVYDILLEEDPRVAEEFVEIFNFDLRGELG